MGRMMLGRRMVGRMMLGRRMVGRMMLGRCCWRGCCWVGWSDFLSSKCTIIIVHQIVLRPKLQNLAILCVASPRNYFKFHEFEKNIKTMSLPLECFWQVSPIRSMHTENDILNELLSML